MSSASMLAMEDEERAAKIEDERAVRAALADQQEALGRALDEKREKDYRAQHPKIARVFCDDWEAWYANGRRLEGRAAQHHKVRAEDVLAELGFDVGTLEVSQEWTEQQGGFPVDLGQIPEEVRNS